MRTAAVGVIVPRQADDRIAECFNRPGPFAEQWRHRVFVKRRVRRFPAGADIILGLASPQRAQGALVLLEQRDQLGLRFQRLGVIISEVKVRRFHTHTDVSRLRCLFGFGHGLLGGSTRRRRLRLRNGRANRQRLCRSLRGYRRTHQCSSGHEYRKDP